MVHSTLFLVPTRNLDALIWLLVEKVIEQLKQRYFDVKIQLGSFS